MRDTERVVSFQFSTVFFYSLCGFVKSAGWKKFRSIQKNAVFFHPPYFACEPNVWGENVKKKINQFFCGLRFSPARFAKHPAFGFLLSPADNGPFAPFNSFDPTGCDRQTN